MTIAATDPDDKATSHAPDNIACIPWCNTVRQDSEPLITKVQEHFLPFHQPRSTHHRKISVWYPAMKCESIQSFLNFEARELAKSFDDLACSVNISNPKDSPVTSAGGVLTGQDDPRHNQEQVKAELVCSIARL